MKSGKQERAEGRGPRAEGVGEAAPVAEAAPAAEAAPVVEAAPEPELGAESPRSNARQCENCRSWRVRVYCTRSRVAVRYLRCDACGHTCKRIG